MTDAHLRQYLEFLERAEQLKSTVRTAYTAAGRRESAAEHSWRLALMAMIFEDEFSGLDHHRLLKLCLVHDLGEAVSGDIPAVDQTAGAPKAAEERKDLLELTSSLPPRVQEDILALWDEYENNTTPEAKVVKGLDKLETLIQHNQGPNPGRAIDFRFNLDYGRRYTAAHPLLEQIRRLVDEATARRAAESGPAD